MDLDLEKFFDRVNHDILIDRLQKRINDAGVIRLIRAYLNSGIMGDDVMLERYQGTPQGGPLSPLRGHCFARYADDCNVYVHSQKAGERVMELLRSLYARLHLTVNETKSAVASVFGRKFLGWKAYFGLSQTPKVWRTLDEWLRHRLRAIQLKHWKRGTTMLLELRAMGASVDVAAQVAGNARRWWRNSDRLVKTVLTIAYFDGLGVPRLS